MAWPLPVASSESPGTSKLSICTSQTALEPSYRPRHRRHRISKPSSSVAPSSGLLILLASVASASTASGSPAPPSFLCPSVRSEDVVDDVPNKRASSLATSVITPSPHSPPVLVPRHVPDRYSEDPDGIWRRVGSYTLYGSTVSACEEPCVLQPTNIASSVDDQIKVSNNQNSTTPSTTPSYDIRDSLPPGWKPTVKPYESRTPLILAMSLVLAFFICSFIIGCLFWRKNVKRGHKRNDVEAKARKKRRSNEEDVRDLVEKEVKAKQRVWARATARWKANVRYSARQRRGIRFTPRLSQAHQSSLSVNSHRSLGRSTSSLRSQASPRSSVTSIPNQLQANEAPVASSSSQEEDVPCVSPAIPVSPPAYQHPGQIPPIIVSSSSPTTEGYSADPNNFDRSRTPSHSSIYPSTTPYDGQSAELLSPTPLHAAHVATDDKALLARLVEFASSPPEDASEFVGTSDAQVCAPAWHDEDIEDFAPDLIPTPVHTSDTRSCSPSLMFPPPPSKDRLVAAELYTYPFSFDEMESMEAEAEPSAPPFEEESSPPLSDSQILPSAPPLSEDGESLQSASHPIAPEWDPMEQVEESVSGQDHDRIATQLTPHESPSSSGVPSIEPHPISTTRDSVTLPGYQP
ncbi:hypothetical protein GALMADRAFT_234673 [Galerina marginata CBS 339.88]|uniref:Uncharacterized protein n=1 Tax=Galerina marginata (strain CBS 339.88) TaxID=685588 RepID=A0A067TR27_GALM3|nr:hypothetical protein GALMADRAFT_234673 [Galerina marginata CBS 339.88]